MGVPERYGSSPATVLSGSTSDRTSWVRSWVSAPAPILPSRSTWSRTGSTLRAAVTPSWSPGTRCSGQVQISPRRSLPSTWSERPSSTSLTASWCIPAWCREVASPSRRRCCTWPATAWTTPRSPRRLPRQLLRPGSSCRWWQRVSFLPARFSASRLQAALSR